MSTVLMVVGYGISSCVIWVGDGGGGVEDKSTIFLLTEGFVVFTFLALSYLFSSSTNRLNCSSTGILFLAASIKILVAWAWSSSSSFEFYCRISWRFPFPLAGLSRFFLDFATIVAKCRIFSFVSRYSGFSVSSSLCCCVDMISS